MDVVTLGDFTVGRGVFEPGWRWSTDVQPIAGTGHDAWTEGDEPCVLIDTGVAAYAEPS